MICGPYALRAPVMKGQNVEGALSIIALKRFNHLVSRALQSSPVWLEGLQKGFLEIVYGGEILFGITLILAENPVLD